MDNLYSIQNDLIIDIRFTGIYQNVVQHSPWCGRLERMFRSLILLVLIFVLAIARPQVTVERTSVEEIGRPAASSRVSAIETPVGGVAVEEPVAPAVVVG
ncbi:unnamed protein product [Bursaphelenchus okinawaensis]|uniref:Uncharacterized protein n=1 Tax=Bursaphelenchus okinawaensis TaxID=465554 RepID=A0A811LE98_9BILA|nr:unnamed protein product [Bursaphelenchus okinawaensis]CAG9121620.1 unnamed protein product [Bursaphelenchus okinawaensis]